MSNRHPITLPTQEGIATGEPTESGTWKLTHPWGEETYHGDRRQARARLTEIMRLNSEPLEREEIKES